LQKKLYNLKNPWLGNEALCYFYAFTALEMAQKETLTAENKQQLEQYCQEIEHILATFDDELKSQGRTKSPLFLKKIQETLTIIKSVKDQGEIPFYLLRYSDEINLSDETLPFDKADTAKKRSVMEVPLIDEEKEREGSQIDKKMTTTKVPRSEIVDEKTPSSDDIITQKYTDDRSVSDHAVATDLVDAEHSSAEVIASETTHDTTDRSEIASEKVPATIGPQEDVEASAEENPKKEKCLIQ